jgi:hypothetical protein
LSCSSTLLLLASITCASSFGLRLLFRFLISPDPVVGLAFWDSDS